MCTLSTFLVAAVKYSDHFDFLLCAIIALKDTKMIEEACSFVLIFDWKTNEIQWHWIGGLSDYDFWPNKLDFEVKSTQKIAVMAHRGPEWALCQKHQFQAIFSHFKHITGFKPAVLVHLKQIWWPNDYFTSIKKLIHVCSAVIDSVGPASSINQPQNHYFLLKLLLFMGPSFLFCSIQNEFEVPHIMSIYPKNPNLG